MSVKLAVKQRLDTQAIPGDEQTTTGLVPQREGKHSAQMVYTLVAVLLVQVDDDFRVGCRVEPVPQTLEHLA